MPPILKKKDFTNVKILMKDKTLLLFLGFVLVLFFHSFSSTITSEEIAQKIEKKYNSLEDVSMEFVQMIYSSVFSDTQEVVGKMYLKNPDKFRIETKKEVITTDGETLWVFSENNKQVTKSKIDKSKKIFKPNQYLYNFRENYKPELTGEEKIKKAWCYRLSLSPKKVEEKEKDEDNLFIKRLILWVDKKSFLVKKLEYQDINDNQVSFIFSRIKTDSKIKDSEFIFKPPMGIEVVDLTR